MNYKTIIENGVTIINTGDAIGGLKNKTGHVGINYRPATNTFRASIFVTRKKRVHLGDFTNLEDAIAIYEEAVKHRDDGTFFQWNETLYGVTKSHRNRKQLGGEGK